MSLLYDFIEKDFGIRGSGRWYSSVEHTSLVYDSEKDIFFWNSQDISGTAYDYLVKVRNLQPKMANELLRKQVSTGRVSSVSNPDDINPYSRLVDILWENGKEKRDYWYNRCLTDSTINSRKLGYYEGWSLLPLDGLDGRFINFQMRRDEPEKSIRYWYRTAQPSLLQPEILQLVDTVYMTEGTVDSILLNQEGIPAIAHTGGAGYWNPEWFPLFHRIKEIYYIADNDKAGRFAAKRIAESLGEGRVKLFSYTGEADKFDTVDYFRSGGTAKELKEKIISESKYIFELGETDGYRTKKFGKSKRFN